MVGHSGQSPPSHGLGSSRTIPTASALTPTGCRNHPRNEHYIVKNFTLKGKDGACGLPGTLNSCASSLSCRQPSDVLPVLGWLPGFLSNAPLRSTLSDVVCGVTVAAVVVPQGMAYGMLAGVPPVYGLYTAMLPPLVYTLLGSCMHLAVGPFALISMLTAAGVQEVVPDPSADPAAAVAAAGVIALFSGLVLVALGILRLGFIATFLSDPVLSGYSTAVSVIIPTSQLKYAFQVHGAHGSFIQTIIGLVKQISEGPVNFFALGIFVVSAILILLLQTINRSKRLPCLKKFPLPAELLVVVLSTAVCRLSDSATGVSVLGRIEKGLPPMQLPQVSQFDLDKLISSVLIVSLMTYITAMSVSKTFARKFGYEVDNNQELLALGCANIIGSLSSSFPAAASFSRTSQGRVLRSSPSHSRPSHTSPSMARSSALARCAVALLCAGAAWQCAFTGLPAARGPARTPMRGYRLDWMLEQRDGTNTLQTQDGYWVGEKGFEKSQGAQGLRYRLRPSNEEYAKGIEVDNLLYQFGPIKIKLGEAFGGTGNNEKLREIKRKIAADGLTDPKMIEENEYWIRRYGHKRWGPAYVDQSQGNSKQFLRGVAAFTGYDPLKEERGVTWFEADYGKPWLQKYVGTTQKGWVTAEQVKKEYDSGKLLN